MCWEAALAIASLTSAGVGVASAMNQPKAPKPPQAPQAPQQPKAPDEAGAKRNNRDAILRAGIASTYKTPLGGVPVGSLNLGSNRLLGG